MEDKRTQDAVVRKLEVIGEATKRLSAELRDEYTDIPWSDMARFRDFVVHQYDIVNPDDIRSIVENDIPPLADQIENVLADLGEQEDGEDDEDDS